MEKVNKIIDYIFKTEIIMGIILLSVISLIACKMPEIMEKDRKGGEISTTSHQVKSKGITIIVDPGHGGIDPGKIGINKVNEKDVNLQIAVRLRDSLVLKGYRVVMTRSSDTGLYENSDINKKRTDMRKRCQLINDEFSKDSRAINISIHQNSYTSENVKGPQVFYYSKSASGGQLAKIIQHTINKNLVIEKPRTEKANDDYYMLVNTDCPSVIVECGFLSNWDEAEKLISESYQNKLTNAIIDAIEVYYG